MADHTPSNVSHEALATAQRGWKNFTRASVVGVVGVFAVLAFLLGVSALNGWL